MRAAIVFFVCIGILPLAAGLGYAACYSLGLVGALSDGFTLDAWANTLGHRNLWVSLALSACLAALVVLLSTGLALALFLKLRTTLEMPRSRFLLHFPLAIPPIVAAFLSFQWLGSSGILARFVYQAGWIRSAEDFPPLINDTAYFGVGFTLILTTFPILLLLMMQHYRAANLLQISDIAATLGASAAQIRRRVVAPVILRRLSPTLLLYGVFLFGAYEVPLLLGRQNPAMISMFIHQKFRRFNLEDLPQAYAATVVYAALVMGVVLIFFKEKRIERSGLSA